MKKLYIILLIVVLTSCSPGEKSSEKTSTGCSISDYGQNVFYFHCSDGFGPALAEFRGKHKIIAVTSYTFQGLGTTGYWVVAE